MYRNTLYWLIAMIAGLGLLALGCEGGSDDDDAADDDDAGDDDVADDDDAADDDSAGDDDDTMPPEDCYEVALPDDGVGTYTISAGDSHERFSFSMDAGVSHMKATVTWDAGRTEWDMELATGTGVCPDNGTEWAAEHATDGVVVTHVYSEDLGFSSFTNGASIFAHVGALNEGDHEMGDSVAFDVDVEYCAPAE